MNHRKQFNYFKCFSSPLVQAPFNSLIEIDFHTKSHTRIYTNYKFIEHFTFVIENREMRNRSVGITI